MAHYDIPRQWHNQSLENVLEKRKKTFRGKILTRVPKSFMSYELIMKTEKLNNDNG